MSAIELNSTSLINDANLVSYYRLENVNDSKASNNLTNNNTVAFNAALFNNGADLGASNTNKSLTTASTLGIDGGAITLCCWIKLSAEIGSGTWHFMGQGNNTSKIRYLLFYGYNVGTIRVGVNRSRNGVADNITYINGALGTSIWHHVALVYDTTNLNVFIDGVAGTPLATSGNGSSLAAQGFSIGTYIDASGNFSSAIIDDAAVFNRALTASEIYNLYIGPATTNYLASRARKRIKLGGVSLG